jgi:hypothetical protein
MTVKIVAEHQSADSPGNDYVRVSTCSDPLDDTVTLATIQRFVERQNRNDASKKPVHVKTLVLKQPMTTTEALGLATCYAARKNIPVVYTD